MPSTENRHIDQVWNPWKSGAGHALHQNRQILAHPDPFDLFPVWERDVKVHLGPLAALV